MSGLGIKDVDFGEHGVIYIKSDQERPFLTEWTKPATADLLRILPKQFSLYNNGKLASKRRLYDNCAIILKSKGYNYTSAQAENKWKSLKRRYLTQHDRLLFSSRSTRGFKKRRDLFEKEIEAVLKIERPSLANEINERSETNLNIPPGFNRKQNEEDEEIDDYGEDETEEYDESEGQEYSQNDEKLVELVLKDSVDEANKNNVFSNNIEYLFSNPKDEAAENSVDENYIGHIAENTTDNDRLVREVKELRKIVKKNLEINASTLKAHNATQEQILVFLDTLDKREEEKLEIKRLKLEKQNELVQQTKIQNSLIAKLIQKLGNNTK